MPRQFFYTAHAVGFAGRITAPFTEVIEAQAASSLGVNGGYSSARVEGFRRHEIFSFASAHTQVSGIYSRKSQSFETLVSGVVEGLNIADLAHVDYVAGRLMSKHPVRPPKEGPDEPSITPLGSVFGKIRVAGYELTPVIDTSLLEEKCTYTELCQNFAKDVELCGRFRLKADKLQLPQPPSLLVGSIVKEIQGGGKGITILDNNTVHVPGFGKLHFGEFTISQYARRLVMVRVELGCPVQGDASGPDMSGNGQPPSLSFD